MRNNCVSRCMCGCIGPVRCHHWLSHCIQFVAPQEKQRHHIMRKFDTPHSEQSRASLWLTQSIISIVQDVKHQFPKCPIISRKFISLFVFPSVKFSPGVPLSATISELTKTWVWVVDGRWRQMEELDEYETVLKHHYANSIWRGWFEISDLELKVFDSQKRRQYHVMCVLFWHVATWYEYADIRSLKFNSHDSQSLYLGHTMTYWGFACEIVWSKVTTREIVPSGVLSCVDGAWRNPGGDVGLSKWKCVDCVQISQEGYTARLERSMPEVYFIERRQLGSTWRSTSYDIDRLVCKLNQWHHIVHQISQVSAHVVSSSVWKSWAKVCHCCTQPSILTLPVENAEHADIPSDRRNHDADTAVNFCPKGQQKLKRTLGSLGCSFGVYNTRNYNVKISETFSEIHEDWCRFEA